MNDFTLLMSTLKSYSVLIGYQLGLHVEQCPIWFSLHIEILNEVLLIFVVYAGQVTAEANTSILRSLVVCIDGRTVQITVAPVLLPVIRGA